jgi:hypothetical protein
MPHQHQRQPGALVPKQSHELRIADRELNKHFAGTYPAYLVLSKKSNEGVQRKLEEAVEKGSSAVQNRRA